MRIGIMAKTFARPSLEEVLEAVKARGLDAVQFNMTCAGLPPIPDQIDGSLSDRIRRELERRGIAMAAVSGTFNMIHPDEAKRREGLRRLEALAAACGRLGTSIITLCTGTRDPEDMWRRQPENDAPEAWEDLLRSMRSAVEIAARHRVTLAFEPEVSNVVDSALKARRLLDQIGSERLKVVMDAANLFHAGELPRMRAVLDEAFDLLGRDIALAHAKDLSRDGEAGHEAAGTGLLDYDHYVAKLREASFK
ncbi:MAG: sugar phosphate isomerase/epimerase, partial [Planctomycetes bacterium]|nr:sugar phosphate isomerase/epimerase [Planctomycetota bacterium]